VLRCKVVGTSQLQDVASVYVDEYVVELDVTEKEVRVASVFVEGGDEEKDGVGVGEEDGDDELDEDSELVDDDDGDEDADVKGSGVGVVVKSDIGVALEDVMETPLDN
jgi:hypothetical protein